MNLGSEAMSTLRDLDCLSRKITVEDCLYWWGISLMMGGLLYACSQ